MVLTLLLQLSLSICLIRGLGASVNLLLLSFFAILYPEEEFPEGLEDSFEE
jgi:hypothetical protein